MLKLYHISHYFDKKPGFLNINLNLNKGEILAVIGESGCGKSTLLKAIYGLSDLDEGQIFWENQQVKGPKYNLIPGHKNFKLLEQEFNLMPYTSVSENISKYLSRQTPEKNKKKIEDLLNLLDLKHLKNETVINLSGGEKQRLALGRALAKKPLLLLLDEPFSHIDQFKKHKLRRQLFNYIQSENITCVIATHDTEDILGFSDKTLILRQAKQVDFRPTTAIYNTPKNKYTAALFGEINSISPAEFNLESQLGHNTIITYPYEFEISEKHPFSAEVLNVVFKGHSFYIYAKFNGQEITIAHPHDIKAKQVNFKPDLTAILNRIS